MNKAFLVATAAVALSFPTTADAATRVYATNFRPIYQTVETNPNVVGAIKVTYDSFARTYVLDYFSMRVNGIHYTANDVIQDFDLQKVGIDPQPIFILRGSLNGRDVLPGTNDFEVQYNTVFSVSAKIATSDSGTLATAWASNIENFDPGAVPEPATWIMMLAGFGMIGGAVRYRRRKAGITLS